MRVFYRIRSFQLEFQLQAIYINGLKLRHKPECFLLYNTVRITNFITKLLPKLTLKIQVIFERGTISRQDCRMSKTLIGPDVGDMNI